MYSVDMSTYQRNAIVQLPIERFFFIRYSTNFKFLSTF